MICTAVGDEVMVVSEIVTSDKERKTEASMSIMYSYLW